MTKHLVETIIGAAVVVVAVVSVVAVGNWGHILLLQNDRGDIYHLLGVERGGVVDVGKDEVSR